MPANFQLGFKLGLETSHSKVISPGISSTTWSSNGVRKLSGVAKRAKDNKTIITVRHKNEILGEVVSFHDSTD